MDPTLKPHGHEATCLCPDCVNAYVALKEIFAANLARAGDIEEANRFRPILGVRQRPADR